MVFNLSFNVSFQFSVPYKAELDKLDQIFKLQKGKSFGNPSRLRERICHILSVTNGSITDVVWV